MHSVWEFLKLLTHPQSIILLGGAGLLYSVIFAETGLFVGFFLPGDSLLFSAGLLCSLNRFPIDIRYLLLGLCLSAIAGNVVGYYVGKKAWQALFKRPDSFLFKKRYLELTHAFYARHGGKALVLGRFLPVIRTFAPILAGVIEIGVKRFMMYNVIGSVAWIFSLTLGGFYLGKFFPGIMAYLDYIIVAMIVVTIIPVLRAYRKEKLRKNNTI